MALLQFVATILNLVPVPPLDGFNALSPMLDHETRDKLTNPPVSTIAFLVYFAVLWGSERPMHLIIELWVRLLFALGFDFPAMEMMRQCFNLGLFGSTDV